MENPVEPVELAAEDLCKSCGLCCSGHLFIWVKLKPGELDAAERLGMHVYRNDPTQRGFSQPCPLWKEVCMIYHSPNYPRACKAYRCKLLKSLQEGKRTFPEALEVVSQVKERIGEVNALLPPMDIENFRERMVSQIEHPNKTIWKGDSYDAFRLKAEGLIRCFSEEFGVNDLIAASDVGAEE